MTNQPKIRAAKPHESVQISALALRSKAHWGYTQKFIDACREELTVSADKINSNKFFYAVAEEETILLGYYAVEKLSEYEFELDALFVEPTRIGTGVGKALMDHAKRKVKELGGRRLIIQGDPNAENFYLAAGAKPIGMRNSASIPGRSLTLFAIDLNSDDTV